MSSSEASSEEESSKKSDEEGATPTSSVIREQKDDEGQGRSAFVSRKTHRVKGQPAKLDGTRRSAKDCRGRRKLRYQYLEDMVTHRERAIQSLRRELETYKQYCAELDEGRVPESLLSLLAMQNETS